MKPLALLTVIPLAFAAVVDSNTPLSFCDLVRDPKKFNGQVVTIRATYHYGFERQQLYCLDCLDMGKTWLEIPWDIDDASKKALRRAGKDAGIVNLTVRGTFMSGSAYGHLGGYRYKFVAEKISNVVVIVKGMKALEEESAAEKKWACGGTNPK